MATFTTLQGLDHLEGLDVHVIADGAFAGIYTVTGGAITLDFPVTKGWVGLPYYGQLLTLPQIGGLQGARARNARRRFDNVAVQYQASVAGFIGDPERSDQFYRFAERTEDTNISEGPAARSAVATQQFAGGWQTDQIEIRPTPGFPLKILKLEGRYVANS